MADLVAHHAGQIGLAVQIGHDAAGHVDVATRQCEGIDLRAVEHGEVPLEAAAVRLPGQPLTQRVDVGQQLRVRVGAVLGQHLLVRLLAFGDLVALAHHRELARAADRIDDRRAGGQRQRQAGGENADRDCSAHRHPLHARPIPERPLQNATPASARSGRRGEVRRKGNQAQPDRSAAHNGPGRRARIGPGCRLRARTDPISRHPRRAVRATLRASWSRCGATRSVT